MALRAVNLSPLAACIRLALAQHGVLSRAQALACRLSSGALGRAVAAGKLERMFPGVYRVPGSPRTHLQELMALYLWAKGRIVFSHRTAASLLRLDGFEERIIEASVPRSGRPPRKGIVLHTVKSMEPNDWIKVEGLPVTNATRTLFDLATFVDQDRLELALECALRRKLTTMSRINWELRRARPGTKAMKRLLRIRGEGAAHTDSALETKTLQVLRKAGFPPPVRQHPITGAKRKKFLDLAYPHVNFFIEVQSFEHHSGRKPWNNDQVRLNELHGLGWHGLLVTDEYLRDHTQDFLDEVAKGLGLRLF